MSRNAGLIVRGLNSTIKPDTTQVQRSSPPESVVLVGCVLEICLGPENPNPAGSLVGYNSARDLGKIRFRDINFDMDKTDDQCLQIAYPLDKALVKYPLPGEQVIIFVGRGEKATEESNLEAPGIRRQLFYASVASTFNNVTYNSYPYLGTNYNRVVDPSKNITQDAVDSRFTKQLRGYDAYFEGGSTKTYKQLVPAEGDVIVQGRFGNTIRLGSFAPRVSSGTPESWSQVGADGSGIMILRVDRDISLDDTSGSTVEDINADDASVYLCTSQRVEMRLSCSQNFKSWRARYGISNTNGSGGTEVSNLEKTKDSDTLYQKL